ncbi:hypothetical protein [Paracoccus pantotrophus]|uniref:hypothetical protein n=1 Tax=Paracoccus pantotrophus TaxID=82367 RepID=UPI000F426D4B|nr:hypothetical protein [Paracoccus pantotrophus]
MRFHLSDTHAYPGCRVRIAEEENPQEQIAEFSDGVIVPCRHRSEGPGIVLTIAPYTTARGTRIDAKSWLLLPDGQTGDWKIKSRLSGAGR